MAILVLVIAFVVVLTRQKRARSCPSSRKSFLALFYMFPFHPKLAPFHEKGQIENNSTIQIILYIKF